MGYSEGMLDILNYSFALQSLFLTADKLCWTFCSNQTHPCFPIQVIYWQASNLFEHMDFLFGIPTPSHHEWWNEQKMLRKLTIFKEETALFLTSSQI